MKANDVALRNALIRERLTQPVGPRRISFIPVPGAEDIEITFKIPAHLAPSLKSALAEIRNEVGGRLEQPHAYATEDAFTRASAALGTLFAAVARKVANYDTDYKPRVGSIE